MDRPELDIPVEVTGSLYGAQPRTGCGDDTMQPLSPLVRSEAMAPNIELLRRWGWSVANISGPYCVAWRGAEEVVFEWRNDSWHRVGGRSGNGE